MTGEREGSALVDPPGDEVRAAVGAVCRRLYAVEDDFVAGFREGVLRLVPELRHVTDTAQIAEGLARAVLWAGLTTDPAGVVEETFRNVGAEYCRRGFPPSAYHPAGHALLRAARELQGGDWSSELSSSWVAFYAWLSAHLTVGATTVSPPSAGTRPTDAPPVPGTVPPPTGGTGSVLLHTGAVLLPPEGEPAPDPTLAAEVPPGPVPRTLDDVLDQLRRHYFAGDDQALGAVVTRVALRTGADLFAPRPDQRANPDVVANVITVLQVMGYVLGSDGSWTGDTAIVPPAGTGRRSRWWGRRRS